MIKVNLLPFRAARKKENIRRQISIFLLTLMLSSVLLTYYHFSLGSKIGRLQAEVDTTHKELLKYKKKAKEVDTIKKRLAMLKKKTQVIENLELNRKEPVYLLDTLPETVVENRMWFTSLAAKQKAVDIKGIALDNTTVADFMTRLEDCGLFSSVNLNTVSRKAIKKNTQLKSFAISCNKAPMKKAPSNKAVKK